MASFMNDWTLDHVAGYQPRSRTAAGPRRPAPGWASTSTPADSSCLFSS